MWGPHGQKVGLDYGVPRGSAAVHPARRTLDGADFMSLCDRPRNLANIAS